MKSETLEKLFKAQYPTGFVHKNGSRITVQFCTDGKRYRYNESNYGLAERLDLIPYDDIVTIAERVLDKLVNGAETVIDQSGAGDTIRWHWTQEEREGTIEEDSFSVDEYQRPISKYWVNTHPNAWA